MEYQYITDKDGEAIAAVIPLKEWEALQYKMEEESLTDTEIKEAEQSWRDYLAGRGEPVEQVMKELLENRND
ncbi:MAG: hypothetical protein JXA79_08875 [Deltaproteobacteria bacterium]|nr:hypothetical protein [Deltaproteobacteria bacterium]